MLVLRPRVVWCHNMGEWSRGKTLQASIDPNVFKTIKGSLLAAKVVLEQI
jgi:hypothetical protein